MNQPAATASPLYPHPDGLSRPLRVAVVAPEQVPGWITAFLELARQAEWLELLVVPAADASLPRVQGVPLDLRGFLAFEHAMLGPHGSLDPRPLPAGAQAVGETLAARVNGTLPDVAILVGTSVWATQLAAQLRCGAWHVDASLTDPIHAGLSLLVPMVQGDLATQVALMLKGPDQVAVDLATSWGRTRSASFLLQREDAFRKIPGLLLRGLHRLAGGYVPMESGFATLQLQTPPAPGRLQGVRALLSILLASRRWITGWRRNGRIGWTVLLRLGGSPMDPEAPVIGSHVTLRAPVGWWGDPFITVSNGRKLLFVEEMLEPKRWNANIACVELVAGGARRLGIALDEPGHLSFPQVFEWEGAWYLTVESGSDRRVSLYRATDFPLGWTRVRDLLTGWTCVDPSLHHHDGHWYLFANIAENRNNTCDELFLFVADSLEGPFVPHPASPIVCDVRRARMAGRLFRHQGRLIRPAQDCGPGYGNAVVFHEVLELSPTTYRERQLSRLAPRLPREMDGCHTYNADAGIEVLDVLGRMPKKAKHLQVLDDSRDDDGNLPHAHGWGHGPQPRPPLSAAPVSPTRGVPPR